VAKELGDPREQGMSLRVLAQALFAAGRASEALVFYEQSFDVLADQDSYEAARTKVAWGRDILASETAERGRALIDEARVVFAQVGAKRDLADLEQIIGRAST
jgi:hypothetical protein